MRLFFVLQSLCDDESRWSTCWRRWWISWRACSRYNRILVRWSVLLFSLSAILDARAGGATADGRSCVTDCASSNEIKAREPIRCRECGCRVMYKKRVKRSTSLSPSLRRPLDSHNADHAFSTSFRFIIVHSRSLPVVRLFFLSSALERLLTLALPTGQIRSTIINQRPPNAPLRRLSPERYCRIQSQRAVAHFTEERVGGTVAAQTTSGRIVSDLPLHVKVNRRPSIMVAVLLHTPYSSFSSHHPVNHRHQQPRPPRLALFPRQNHSHSRQFSSSCGLHPSSINSTTSPTAGVRFRLSCSSLVTGRVETGVIVV